MLPKLIKPILAAPKSRLLLIIILIVLVSGRLHFQVASFSLEWQPNSESVIQVLKTLLMLLANTQ